ncbi:MAG: alpha/beta hydrolase [Rhodoblastus sp.]
MFKSMRTMSRSMRIGGVFAICLTLAACGGRPNDVLLPSPYAPPPGGSKVDMLVATTRSADGAIPGQMFTGKRGNVAYADVAVSIPPDAVREVGEIQWPDRMPGNPAREFVTLKADRLDEKSAVAQFRSRIARTPDRRVLVFVHGYNTKFDEAVYRFAQVMHDSQAPALPVLFTWPSRGRLLDYGYDRESTAYSRIALEDMLQTLVKDPGVGEIDILAHSMGNEVTLGALHLMAVRDKRISRKIKQVILASPDVDYDVFRKLVTNMGPDRPAFTMLVARDDKALAMSRRIWGDMPRAGAINPAAEPYRSELAAANIQAFDLTDARGGDSLNHSKFAQSPKIVQLLGQRIAAGQTLGDSRGGLGERLGVVAVGAASTIGKAAGVAISAPIAVIDPQTRESLAERVQDVGEGLTDTVRSTVDVPGIR